MAQKEIEIKHKDVVMLQEQGLSQKAVADRYGVSTPVISAVLKSGEDRTVRPRPKRSRQRHKPADTAPAKRALARQQRTTSLSKFQFAGQTYAVPSGTEVRVDPKTGEPVFRLP